MISASSPDRNGIRTRGNHETGGTIRLVANYLPPHSPVMFIVTEADSAAIRAALTDGGELSAALELRRRFPGIRDNAQARLCVRAMADWRDTPEPSPQTERRGGKGRASKPKSR